MLAFLPPGLSKWFSSFKIFLASKHTTALRLVGSVISSEKGEPSSGVYLVPISRMVALPVKCRKINAFSLDPVLGQISRHG